MNEKHASIDDLLRLREGELADGELVPLSRHLAACDECAALAQGMFAGDVERLGRIVAVRPPRRAARIIFAAAAAILAVIVFALLLRRSPVVPAPPHPAPPSPWDSMKAEALHDGSIAAPAVVAAVRPLPGEQIRGGENEQPATALQPNGVVVEETRPRFRWRAGGGTTAIVSVFANGSAVARSPAIRGTSWTPDRDLPRGVVLQWQMEVTKDGRTYIVPAAPRRPPMFAIVDEAAHRQLDEVRRRAPGDHLLLAIVAARAGLQQDALAEFDRHAAAHPNDDAARTLAASVRRWGSE